MASRVFWMDDRSQSMETSLVAKMLTVFRAAGLEELIQPYDVVAIKIHCGEYNNTGYLRPVYARALADEVKRLGGRPFVTDTTTAFYGYYGTRTTALDEMLTAERNGFSSAVLGCPFIVADGFLGTDDILVDLPEGTFLKQQYIAKAIALADRVIALTHFKGHGAGVFGGTIKNIGVGAASKRGKLNLHFGGHEFGWKNAPFFPHLIDDLKKDRRWLEGLRDSCPWGLFEITDDDFVWHREECTCGPGGGGPCSRYLSAAGALEAHEAAMDINPVSFTDSALACAKIVGLQNMGFINLAIDITPNCDCSGFSDRALVPNVGVFASKDMVAIDAACRDKVTEAPGLPGSRAYEVGVSSPGVPKFAAASARQGTSDDLQLANGERIGLGSRGYELIECPPGSSKDFRFHWDPRPVAQRVRKMLTKDPIKPEGGFQKRERGVDIESLLGRA